MITYDKVIKQYDFYKACYEKIDALYWNNIEYTANGEPLFSPSVVQELKEAYTIYRTEVATTLTLINDYSKSRFKLYEDEISLMRRDMADYDNRIKRMLNKIL